MWLQIYPHDNPPPTISSFAPVTAAPGSPTSISVTASDPNDATLSYTWDFGDGTTVQTTSTNSVSHTFATAGNYTVKVRVKDAEWPTCATTTATIRPGGVAALATDFGASKTVQIVPDSRSGAVLFLVPWAIVVAITVFLIGSTEIALQRDRLDSKESGEGLRTRGSRPP